MALRSIILGTVGVDCRDCMFKAAAAAAELEAIGVEAEIGVDRLAEGVEVTGATGRGTSGML